MSSLTANQRKVLAYLREVNCWASPTEIGNIVGGRSTGRLRLLRHSAWASPICKRLVTLELVERNEQGHYRIILCDGDSAAELDDHNV